MIKSRSADPYLDLAFGSYKKLVLVLDPFMFRHEDLESDRYATLVSGSQIGGSHLLD